MAEEIIVAYVMVFFAFLFMVALVTSVFWIWMIVDCARRKFKTDNDKLIWIIILALLGWLGAIIYYFVIKVPDKY